MGSRGRLAPGGVRGGALDYKNASGAVWPLAGSGAEAWPINALGAEPLTLKRIFMRARNIKPGFFKNEMLGDLPPMVRLLFAGLWCMADRSGRLEDRPKRIRAEILPYDDCDVDGLLQRLAGAGFIRRYVVNGKRFICIPTFLNHQKPHNREKPSDIPPLIEGTDKVGPRHDLGDAKASPGLSRDPLAVPLIPDSLNPDSCTSSKEQAARPPALEKTFLENLKNPNQELVAELVDLCKRIHDAKILGKGAKRPFNPYQWVKQRTKKSVHPEALAYVLRRVEREGPVLKNPWGFADKIMEIECQNFNERDAIRKHERLKKELGIGGAAP